MLGSAAPVRGRPRDDGRAQAILAAALELLADVGYERLSMEAVATRARASKATLYRWWPGKAQLVAAALGQRSCAAVDGQDHGSLRADLLALLGAVCVDGADDAPLLAGMVLAMRSDPVLAGLLREQMGGAKRAEAGALVARAVARGELPRTSDPHVIVEIAPAVLFFRLLVTGEPVDPPFVLHLVDDVLLPLLTTPTPTPSTPSTPTTTPPTTADLAPRSLSRKDLP